MEADILAGGVGGQQDPDLQIVFESLQIGRAHV